MRVESEENNRGKSSNLEEILETIDTSDLEEENFLATVKKLRGAEKEDDARYPNEFNRHSYRSSNYSKFLDIRIVSEKQKRFFLGKVICCGKKTLNNYNDNYRAKGFKKEVFESKIGAAHMSLAKTSTSPDFIRKWIEKGVPFLKEAIEDLIFYRSETKKDIYSFTGQAFSNAWTIRATSKNGKESRLDNLNESDLENLVMGITCQELSRDYDNHDAVNYQTIGREYYDLQYLIEKAGRNQAGKINVKMIKDKIKEVLDKKSKKQEKIFEDYQGGLRHILELENTDKLTQEMQFIAVESAYGAFEKSHRPPKGRDDDSLDNRSYRGACLVDLVGLNRWLNKFDNGEAKRKLEEARLLLEEVKEERKKEFDEIEKGSEEYNDLEGKLAKDCTRLAECYFRLADGGITQDVEKRRELYKNVIDLNTEAIKLGRRVFEVYGFRAASKYKLVEPSISKKQKKEILEDLEELVKEDGDFELAFKEGDDSTENRSKKGSCYLNLLEFKLKENDYLPQKREVYRFLSLFGLKTKEERKREKEIDRLVKETKEALKEAVKINESKRGSFVYPYFLLYFLSKDIEESGRNPKRYSLKNSEKCAEESLEIYFQKEWQINRIGKSKNYVYEPLDNYGLLAPIFVLKYGMKKNLQREKEIVDLLRKKLEKEFGKNRKYLTAKPLVTKEYNNEDLGGMYYIMTRKHGLLLEDILKDEKGEKFEILKDVVDYLAFIHTNLQKPNISFRYEDYVRERLNEISVDEKITDIFTDNYSPIRNALEEATFVFYKDAHPRNWIIKPTKKRQIVALDFEEKSSCPIESDLVCLLEPTNLIYEEKEKLISLYNDSYKKYSGKNKEVATIICYLNMTVLRAIQILSWPTSIISIEQKKEMLEKARESIEQTEKVNREFYNRFSSNYNELKKSIGYFIDSIL